MEKHILVCNALSVLIAMKRKIDLVDEEHESEDEENESSSDEGEDEEPRIKDVLSHLSQAVSVKRASEWPLPKIFYSGLPADNYFEINV